MAKYDWQKTEQEKMAERRKSLYRSIKMGILVLLLFLLALAWMVLQRTTIVIANGHLSIPGILG